jgi:PelA/Pel-15E family pectate lyase
MKLLRRVLLGLVLPAGVVAGETVVWRTALDQALDWYATPAAGALADHLLLYQFENGGWPKNREMSLPPATEAARRGAPVPADEQMPTIDNGATHRQLVFLARVVSAGAGREAHRRAVGRGLDYLLAAQYPGGGWPQFFPRREGYYSRITFNDEAMIGVLTVLHDVARGRAPFTWVDADRRARAAVAVARGVDCILRCQVTVDGVKTAWCAQHDEYTFAPAPARAFEPVSLSGGESVEIVRFLMEFDAPSAEIVASVEAAVAWFEAMKLTGLRYEHIDAPGLPRGRDSRVTADPAAPALGALF